MSNEQRRLLDVLQPQAAFPSCGVGEPEHCLTCSDEAVPARVLYIDGEANLALAAIGERTAEIDVSLVEAVTPGEWVLVLGGVAIARLEATDDRGI